MPRYQISSGKIYNIPDEKVQDFLFKYPDAVLLEKEKQGKIEGPVMETAVAGPMTEPQQQAVDTVSVLEDTSLESPEVDFNIPDDEITVELYEQMPVARKKQIDYSNRQRLIRERNKKSKPWEEEFASELTSTNFEDLNINQIIKLQDEAKKEIESEYSINEDYEITPNEISLKAIDIFNKKIKPRVPAEQEGFFEEQFGENIVTDFLDDITLAAKTGYNQAEMVDPSFELLKRGGDVSDKDILNFIETQKSIAAANMQSDEMRDFNRIYEENDGGVLGFIKGVAKNPSILPSLLVSSLATQAGSIIKSDEVAYAATAGAVAGTPVPILGTIGGTIAGAAGAMESALTFSELLQEEAGEDLSVENIRAVLDDEEKYNSLVRKSLGRGLTIGFIEGITGPIAAKVGSNLAKKGVGEIVRTTTVGGIEATGGGTGEVLGRAVAGQPMDVAEIGFEAVTGTATAPITVGSQLIDLNNTISDYKVRKEVKNLNQENIAKAFDKEFGTTTAQVKLSQLPNSEKILNEEVDRQVRANEITKEKGDEIKLNFRETQGTVNRLKPLDIVDANLDSAVELVKEKTELQQKIKQVNEAALTEAENQRVKEIDIELKRLMGDVGKTVGVARSAEALGIKTKLLSPEQFAEQAKKDNIASIEQREDLDEAQKSQAIKEAEAKDYSNAYGGYALDGTLYINVDKAQELNQLNIGAHEVLHPILNALVGDAEAQGRLVEDFKKQLAPEELELMDETLLKRNYKTQNEINTEYLNVFSDLLQSGDIKLKPESRTKLGVLLNRLFKALGFKKLSIENGKGVYEFMREYNKAAKKGALSDKIIGFVQQQAKAKGITTFQPSKTELKDEIDVFVQKDGAKKYETKAEFQMSNDFTDAYTKIADSNLLDGSILSIINRDDNLSGLPDNIKAEIIEKTKENVSMRFLQNFDPAKNESLFGWMLGKNGALGFAVLDIKKDYAKTAKETSLDVEKGEVGYVGDIAVEPTTEETIDTGIKEARVEGKLIDPVDIIPDKDLQKKYRETVQSKVKDLTQKELSFKGLKDLAPEITAEVFGVPVKKVTDAAANLSKGDATNAQMFITKNADKLIKLLPEGAVLEAATEKLIGTSTGVPKKLLEAFYDKQERVTKGAGLFPYQKKANISKEDFLKAFGIIEGKKATEFSPRSAEAQAIKGLMSMFGKLMTNTAVRKELSKDVSKELLVYNASPRSFKELGERTGLIFLATDKREAGAYAEMNRGEVKDIYIDENTIATEKQALSVMKDLGIDTTEGNFYELIDPRFEEFYIGKNAVDQVTSILADNGFKAVKYEDGGQVSKTTESIVVFDKSAISDKKVTKATIQDIAAGKSQLQFSRTLSSEMSAEKGNVFWDSKNIKTFKDLVAKDPENIGNHFKEVYGGIFDNQEKIAKELDTEYKNWKKLDQDKKDNIEEHIINFITSFGLRAGLRNNLGLGKDSLNFRNKKQLESARKALQELTKNISEEDFMKYLLPTLQSGWGLIGGKFVAEKNSDGYILTEINEDGSKSFRYHLVSGRNDAINVLLQGVFDNETSYTPRSTEAIINGKKIKTTVVPDQTANSFADGKFEKDLKKRQDFAKDQRNGMLKISAVLQELLNNGSINANDVGMILMTFASNTNALIRTAAIPQNKFDGDFSENTEFVYEHSKPAREVLTQIADLISNNKLNKKTYNNVMKDYVVTILPKAYDNIINKYYKDFSPIDQDGNYLKSTADKPSRYFNDLVEAEIAAEGLPPLKLIQLGKKPKRKVVLQFSKSASKKAQENRQKILDTQFNNILENKTGIGAEKEYSAAKAEVVGASKGKFNWFIPPTAEDFTGLLYQFLGKGKLGDRQMAWFKVNLLDPYAKAMSKVSRDRVSTARNYRALKKELKIVPKDLKKKIPGEGFTVEQAVRVYIWHKQGYEIPGLSQQDSKELRNYVNSKPELKEFGDKLILLNRGFDYAKPKVGWLAGTITTDMLETLNTTKRAEYLKEWQNNVDVIFSEKNLNKIEAAYGPKFRYALENVLTRMKTGRNRIFGTDSLTGRFTDWLTNSIGAIMFFNTRSAVLQTISAVNFINLSDNNPLAATRALANQKQYWSDFIKLFNSDFLVDRRDGLRLNVNESDIADMAKKNGARGVISEILKAGFLPTQLADSFAIASGGAAFYRNRLNRYLKEGIDPKKAEKMAFTEFREIAEESQQSSRPDKISAQQAGPLGRIILAFANTPAQYARLMKKAVSDLKNNRGDAKTNISKLIYYGVAQNFIFSAMQQALFAIMFGDEEEEDEKKEKKVINIANSMADSILRGMGVSGAIVSVLKNTVKKLIERSEKREPDYGENALMQLFRISPPVASKASKIKNALRSYEWDKDEMYEKGLALDNPVYLAAGNIISAATNVPLDRAVKKVTNVKNAMNEDLQLWQRIALLSGWQDWEIDAKEEDKERENRKKIKFKTTGFKQTKFK